jgi:hypothetical protein
MPKSAFDSGLYVAEVSIGANKLVEEHWLEIAFRFFNATNHRLAVTAVDGVIECAVLVDHSTPEDKKFKLPIPGLLRDRSNLHDIPPQTETIIVLQQLMSPQAVQAITDALNADGLQFYFDDLTITLTAVDDPTATAALPIPMGAFLRKQDGGLSSGRVTRLRVNAAIGSSST